MNNPSPWSQKIFASCRLSRTLCRVVESHGVGVGGEVFTSAAEANAEGLLRLRGVTAVHVLERDRSVDRPRTNEESLRAGGRDASVERVLVVEGHDLGALELPGERYRLSHVVGAP